MHELHELKEMLMDELKQYGKKGELTSGTLDAVDKLAHAVKSLCYIIEEYEEEYSNATGGDYRRTVRYPHGGNSYARGRRNARRDSMGRYSRDGYSQAVDDMAQELRELMEDAPDEKTRQEFQRFIQKIEQM